MQFWRILSTPMAQRVQTIRCLSREKEKGPQKRVTRMNPCTMCSKQNKAATALDNSLRTCSLIQGYFSQNGHINKILSWEESETVHEYREVSFTIGLQSEWPQIDRVSGVWFVTARIIASFLEEIEFVVLSPLVGNKYKKACTDKI